jgi:hypothetical protein
MSNYNVKFIFKEESKPEYIFPIVQYENGSDIAEQKDLIIEGTRADGSVLIPAGKKHKIITLRGILFGGDYKILTEQMNAMKIQVTTNLATLSMKHLDPLLGEVIDWVYTVKRYGRIEFVESLRTSTQRYTINFIVLAY